MGQQKTFINESFNNSFNSIFNSLKKNSLGEIQWFNTLKKPVSTLVFLILLY